MDLKLQQNITILNKYFHMPPINLDIDGLANFKNTTLNSGAVKQAIFSGSAVNTSAGVVVETAIFAQGAVNDGEVQGNATFSQTAINNGSVVGDATFNGNAVNDGVIQGNATFIGNTINTGTVQGDAWVAASAVNNGTVQGTQFVYIVPSVTPTHTPPPTPTPSITLTSSITPTPSNTASATPAVSPSSTNTPTPAITLSATPTSTPPATPATTSTATPAITPTPSATMVGVDPYFSQVQLLLGGEDASGSTTSIIDSSSISRSFTLVGTAARSTSVKRYLSSSIAVLGGGNTASLYQPGPGTISIAANQAFTIESWVYLTASGKHCLLGSPNGGAYVTEYAFGIWNTGGPNNTTGVTKGLCCWLSPTNGYGGNVVYSGQYPTLNEWTHIAICRSAAGNWTFYMNGVKGTTYNGNVEASTQSDFPANNGPAGAMTVHAHIGNFGGFVTGGNSSQQAAGFNGYIDELRVTVGTDRYTANFTPAGVIQTVPVGQTEYIVPGTYSWLAPSNVTSVNAVAIGAGGGGAAGFNTGTAVAQGGGGGGLGWKNNIPVIPGNTYTVTVGAGGPGSAWKQATAGGSSWFISSATVAGNGGGASTAIQVPSAGGTYVGTGGGNGGTNATGADTFRCSGGGGAGGYSGTGGTGGWVGAGSAGAGGGGGGGAGCNGSNTGGGGGGGTGIYGQGSNGSGGAFGAAAGPGTGGSSGASGIAGSGQGGAGGAYGGGGGAGTANSGARIGDAGAGGAVRLIWGNGRAFPAASTANL